MKNNEALMQVPLGKEMYLNKSTKKTASQLVYQIKPNISITQKNEELADESYNLSKNQTSKVALPTTEGLDFVQVNDIVRCEGSNKYTKVFIEGRKPLLCSCNIGKFKNLLSAFGFFLTHKSHLVNLNCINQYRNEGVVLLEDGAIVPVSVRKRSLFLDSIQRL